MPEIDGDRLLSDLRELARFGAYKTGVHRPTYTPDDVKARDWFASKVSDAGLDVEIDGIGNLLGRAGGSGRKLLIGSHLETQSHAGWLDGALGCIYALEVARALRDAGEDQGGRIDVVAFADEEGHFGSRLGSRSFIGDVTEDEIDSARSRSDARTLREALDEAGYAGRRRMRAQEGRYLGFLEAHIEQGRHLESASLRLGIVTGIAGLWQFEVTSVGVQNHAGTTRMVDRKDAGVPIIRLANALLDRFPEAAGENTVWTLGDIGFDPGAPSIVPGAARMAVQFRDSDRAILETFESILHNAFDEIRDASPCELSTRCVARTEPTDMADGLQAALENAAEHRAPRLHRRMPSMAGHDAQMTAEIMASGMLFVPSIGGISHHWTEHTHDEDIVLGCQVMADAAAALLREEG